MGPSLPSLGGGGPSFQPQSPMTSKTCTQCYKDKPESEFYFRKDTRKLRNQCAQCCTEHARRRDTGWSPEEFADAFAKQQGRCKICKVHHDDLKQGLMADHCHAGLTTRSLLCGRCNSGLGMFVDNPRLLRNAAMYLEYHTPTPDSV
jgi:hypothetical protein